MASFLPVQALAAQVSVTVQTDPSSQALVFAVATQDPLLQLSSVQRLLSSQFLAVPAVHLPALQTSPSVQLSRSSQPGPDKPTVVQLPPAQASVVQTLPSLQTFALPGRQTPSLQLSLSVQPSPSSQAPVGLTTFLHTPVTQASAVQAFLSSQLLAGPALHLPAAQTSVVVHASPSLQAVPSARLL